MRDISSTWLKNSTEMNGKKASFELSEETSLGDKTDYNTVTIGINRAKYSISTALNSIKISLI